MNAEDGRAVDPLRALECFAVTDEQVAAMQATRMIWRNTIAHGHAQVWAAPANGGKTTIAKLAAGELSADGFTVLFFQEDAGAGDLPRLHAHAKQNGYHLLNSTLSDSNPEKMIQVLRALVSGGADLSNYVLFLDTLKKFLDLMNKRGARDFFALTRGLTQRGATVIMLGHTNKHPTHDGKYVFEGVGDVRNDVDELIYIEASAKDAAGIVFFTTRPDKVRCPAREATFRFDTTTLELEPQDEVVDVRARRARAAQMHSDDAAIRAIESTLGNREMPFTWLSKAAAEACGIGEKTVRKVIERYVGSDSGDQTALWYERRARETNARMISCRPRQTAQPAKPAKPTAEVSAPEGGNNPKNRMDAGFGKLGKVGRVGRVGKLGQEKGATPVRQIGKELTDER